MSYTQTIRYIIFAIVGGCVIGLMAVSLTNYPLTTIWTIFVFFASVIVLRKDKRR